MFPQSIQNYRETIFQSSTKKENAKNTYTPYLAPSKKDSFLKSNSLQFSGKDPVKYDKTAFAKSIEIEEYLRYVQRYGDYIPSSEAKAFDFADFSDFMMLHSKLGWPLSSFAPPDQPMDEHIKSVLTDKDLNYTPSPEEKKELEFVYKLWRTFRNARKAKWRAAGQSREASSSDSEG